MGSQRIVSKIGDLESFGADPRRVVYAGHDVDGIDEVDFAGKYQTATSTIKEYDNPQCVPLKICINPA